MKSFLVKLIFIASLLARASFLQGVYIQVYQDTMNGGIATTGNTLGLSGSGRRNEPGLRGTIGAFITQDMSSKVNSYPFGTTLDYTQNGSTAFLDLPPGSVVLHAELIWGGSYGQGTSITLPLVNSTQINFVTPDGTTHLIAAKDEYPNGTGQQALFSRDEYAYVRTQDVTALVAADVAAFVAAQPNDFYSRSYIVGGVPAKINPLSSPRDYAGWCLVVAFENAKMNTNQLTITTGCELYSGAQSPTLQLSGFRTPAAGNIAGYLFLSGFDGDSSANVADRDQFILGPGDANPPQSLISGTNNPTNNFFCSQLNTVLQYTVDVNTGKLAQSGSGQLDTRGSFGLINHDPFTPQPVSGGRQGLDVTIIDISPQLVNNQTELYTRAASGGELRILSSIALQIQQNAPLLIATQATSATTVNPGETVTLTTNFQNVGQDTAANLIFLDLLPPELTFNSGTFNLSVNRGPPTNIPISASDLTTGVDLSSVVSNLEINDTIAISFDVTVATFSATYENTAQIIYTPVQQTLNLIAETNSVTLVSAIAPLNANPDFYSTVANTPLVIPAPGILSNDVGSSLTAIPMNNFSTTLGGQVSVFLDGSFIYTPPSNYSGSGSGADTFEYTIVDAVSQTATSTVTITITPQAVSDFGSVAANTTLNAPFSILSNDLGSPPFQLINFTQPIVTGSSVTVNADGTYVYTPATGFSGVDSFDYTMEDSFSQQSLGTVTINVLPVASDDVGITPANTTLNGTSVFSNDPSTGTLTAFQNPSAQGGTVSMEVTGPNAGHYTYTPPTNFSGLDTFTYTISDGVNPPATATVRITVTPIAQPDAATTSVNTPLNQAISVLNNDIGRGLFVASTGTIATIQNGTVTMNVDGTYLYQPPLNSTRDDSFDYTLEDQAGSQSTAEIVIKLLPILNNDFETTFINTLLLGSSVLANDPHSNELIVVSNQIQSDAGGIVMMNINGTFSYTPPTNFIGTDHFSYTAQDPDGDESTGLVSINVIPRPAPPAPEHFVGYIAECLFLNKSQYRLLTTWTAPNSPTVNISAYRIYRNGVLVKTIPANDSLIFSVCSSSKKYFSGYTIVSVSDFGVESSPTQLEIVKD